MRNIEFQLLGKADENNPSAISRTQISKWEKEGIIIYLGTTEDVREYLANASCIVLPTSYREGIPRVLLEAMATHKPIITTTAPGCKEMVANAKQDKFDGILIGDNGILCQPKDSLSLNKAIEYFLNLSPQERYKMGRSGGEFVKKFDIKKIIAFYRSRLNIQPQKLSFTSNTSFGMYHFRLEVLKELQNEGFIIHILSPKDDYSDKLIQEGFFHHPIKMDPKGLNPLKDLQTFLQIKKILRSISPAISFNYTIKPVIYASLACRILKIPTINIITGLGYVFTNKSFKKRILRALVSKMYQISLKKSREVWFLNLDDKKEFINKNIISSQKAFLLESEGINLEYFTPNDNNTPQNKDVFLLIARMLWDKGVGEFVQVAKAFKTPKNQ